MGELSELELDHVHWPPFIVRNGRYFCCCGVEVVGGNRATAYGQLETGKIVVPLPPVNVIK
jgi:hypothetical protein